MATPPAPPRPDPGPLRAALVLAAALAAFFLPALLTSGQFLFRDAGRMHWPIKRYLAQELARGHLPQWNPFLGLGVPLVGDAVNAVQHPFNLLLLFLPFATGYKLWVLLSFLVGAGGAFAWARRLGLSWYPALAAGLAFGLSGFLVSSTDNLHYLTTLAAVPWMLAAGQTFAERPTPSRLALVGAASALAAASGDPMSWGFAVAALAVLPALVAGTADRRRRLGRGLAAAAAAMVFAAPFILPVLAWMPHSSRAVDPRPVELQRWNLHPMRLLELAVPHVFRPPPGGRPSEVYWVYSGERAGGTTLPWALSVYAGASVVALAGLGAARQRSARLLLAAALLFAWMAMGPNAGFWQLARHLPVLSKFRYWEKVAGWPALFLAPAAALGLEALSSDERPLRRFRTALLGLGGLALALWGAAALFPEGAAALLQRGPEPRAARLLAANLGDGLLQAGLAWLALGLAVLAVGLRPRLPPALLVLPIVLLDLFAGNGRAWLLAPPAVAEPRSPLADHLLAQPGLQRVIAPFESDGDRWPELPPAQGSLMADAMTRVAASTVPRRVGSFQPYVAMVPERLWALERHRPWEGQAPICGLWGVSHLVVPGDPSLAVRAHLSPPYQVDARDPGLPAFLVRLPHRERAYLAGALSAVDAPGALAFALDPASAAGSRTVLEGEVEPGYAPPRGGARIVVDQPERVSIETTSDRRAVLVLNDMHAPGWRATVDGRPAPILHANYLARGVWVPEGTHRVEFAYRTPMLLEGWGVAAAGAAALAAFAAFAGARHRSGRDR